MLRTILLLILVSLPTWAQESVSFDEKIQNSLNILKKEQLVSIDEARPALLDEAWPFVVEMIETRRQWLAVGSKNNGNLYERFIKDSFDRLRLKKQIFLLTTELEKKIVGLSSASKTANLKAFYIPYFDMIFIKDPADVRKFASSLYHELIHVVQFSYQFPLDINILFENSKSGTIKESDLVDYLGFHCEAQANWHEMQGTKDSIWLEERAGPDRWGTFKTFVTTPFGLGRYIRTGDGRRGEWTNYVPSRDIVPTVFYGNVLERSALATTELIVLGSKNCLGCMPFDLKFHQQFARRLVETYYGKLPIVFQDKAKDQKIFKAMFEEFYDNVISWEKDQKIESKECYSLREKIFSYPSPIQGWLSLSTGEIKSCTAYSSISDNFGAHQENFKAILSRKLSTPFVFIMEGTEGGHTDIDFLPSIPLLPQLEITPKKVKAK